MKLTPLIIFIIFLFGCSTTPTKPNDLKSETNQITSIVTTFYDWYITAIKAGQVPSFQPIFTRTKNGSTTLNYSFYINNLKRMSFSKSLIKREKNSYSKCIKNLKKVKFSDFLNSKIIDLDEFRAMNCDFSNNYRWISGQEPIDGIKIKNVSFISAHKASLIIEYFNSDKKTNKKHYWGRKNLTLIKIDDSWYIDEIESPKLEESNKKTQNKNSYKTMISTINTKNSRFVTDGSENINKLVIDKNNNHVFLTANIKMDHRIFGFSEPTTESEVMILFSVFTDDVETNPFNCTLGSYYDTSDFKSSVITYLGSKHNFIKTKITHPNGEHVVYFEKKWVEYL